MKTIYQTNVGSSSRYKYLLRQIFLPAWLSLPFLSVREGLACLEATAVFINVSSFQNRAGARRPAARHTVFAGERRAPGHQARGGLPGSVSAVPSVQGFLVDANDVLNAHFLHFCHIGIPIFDGFAAGDEFHDHLVHIGLDIRHGGTALGVFLR